jgi:hypothetical protein
MQSERPPPSATITDTKGIRDILPVVANRCTFRQGDFHNCGDALNVVCIGGGHSLARPGLGTHELEEFRHKNQFRGLRRGGAGSLVELRGIPWRRRYCAPPDIKMPVIDVCTVPAERMREMEREAKRERERSRYAIRRGGQWDARHPSPSKRHLTKIRGCHNGVILRLPAGTILFLCDHRRGVSAARPVLEKKKKGKIRRHRARQSVYLYPRKSSDHCVPSASEGTQPA